MRLSGKKQIAFVIVLAISRIACALNPATAEPSPTPEPPPTEVAATCADIDANWGKDWAAVLTVLEQLLATDETCGAEPLAPL